MKRKLRRESGIALMVVMVVFIILYLVVFQLHYTTKLEERLSRARSADAMGSAAIRSVMFYILELLAEDYQKGSQGSTGAGGAASTSSGAGNGMAPGGAGDPAGKSAGGASTAKSAGPASSAGTDPTAAGASATGGPTWTDYRHKDLFLPNEKNLNDTTVKILMRGNEGSFDLNQLWNYPPSQAETLTDANKEQENADARKTAGDPSVQNALKQADPTGRTADALKGSRSSSASKSTSGAKSAAGTPAGAGGAQTGVEQAAVVEFVPPDPEKRTETVKMLVNAIDLMYRLNVQNGFEYMVQPPPPEMLADAIERYCFERRSQTYQNYIHLTSELLNVLAMLGVDPELARKIYYGPEPLILPGEDFFDHSEEFRYSRDDYGDLVGEYVYADTDGLAADREAMQSQLAELQGMFGQYQDFSGLGFGRMGNPMTRGMKEYSEYEDEKGNVSLKVPPEPVGLKDLFTTFSTGKICMNLAPVPVLYALLPLIIETEPDGKRAAQEIAIGIEQYLNTYQSEYDESDPIQSEQKTSSAGAPHRSPSADGTAAQGGPRKAQAGAAGPSNLASLSPEELAAAAQSGGRSDYQTNYFTNLTQLKLVRTLLDKGDDPEQYYLTDKNASTSVELAKKSPLDKAIHDYQQVMVFGCTYFTATLKSKTKDSSAVKTGYLTIIRDIPNHRMEVIQWKELQR